MFWLTLVKDIIKILRAGEHPLAPWIAAAAMSLSSVSVISNALRLRRAKLD